MIKVLLVICFLVISQFAHAEDVWLVCTALPNEGITYDVEETKDSSVNIININGPVVDSDGNVLLIKVNGYASGLWTWRVRGISKEGWPGAWSNPFTASRPEEIVGGIKLRIVDGL